MLGAPFRRLATQAARPAVSVAAPGGGGLMQMIFDAPSQLPLNEEVAGVPALAGRGAAPTARQTTKLANGLTVTSEDRHGSTSSLGLFVKAGSRHDSRPGMSAALQRVAFAATQQRSAIKLARDLEDIGATVAAKTGREVFAYTGESLREHAGEMAEALIEAATQPKLFEWEVAEQLHELEAIMALHAAEPAMAVSEGVHAAAFGASSALGHSLIATPAQLHAIDAEGLRGFLGGRFFGEGMCLSATNVDHRALVALAENLLGGVARGAAAAAPRATVVGGESLTRSESGVAHVAIALPAPDQASGQLRALLVLQALLGSTGSRGGAPGSARLGYTRQSRLAAGAKGETQSFMRSATAFSYAYSDAGLLGIAGTCADHEAGQFVAAAVGVLKDAAGNKPIRADELERAKRACKLAYLADAEGRQGARDEAGTAALLGRASGAAEVLRAFDAVTAEQVAAVARTALQGPPSLAATGSLATVQRYDVLAGMLR